MKFVSSYECHGMVFLVLHPYGNGEKLLDQREIVRNACTGHPKSTLNVGLVRFLFFAGVAHGLKPREIAQSFARSGADPVGSLPAALDAFGRKELAKWSHVFKVAGIKAN